MQPLPGAVCLRPVCDGDGLDSGVYGHHALAGGAGSGTCGAHWILNGWTCQYYMQWNLQ